MNVYDEYTCLVINVCDVYACLEMSVYDACTCLVIIVCDGYIACLDMPVW